MSYFASKLSAAVLNRLPMWSEVGVMTDNDGHVVLIAILPCHTAEGLEWVPAFRLEISPMTSSVYFVNGSKKNQVPSNQVPSAFKDQADRMVALHEALKEFWHDMTHVIWAALSGD